MSSFLEAAFQILSETDHPMSAKELTQVALDKGLLETQGVTPAATMAALIYVNLKRKGSASKFVQIAPGQFDINKNIKAVPELRGKKKTKKEENSQKTYLDEDKRVHNALTEELLTIRTFLIGKNEQIPSNEKICDWVNLCYSLELFTEGAELFIYVDPIDVNDWYYERTKKMAKLCTLRKSSHE